jgi:predicted YcjX-like family ATPase
LSRSGKTTFVTALIHALLGQTNFRHLPLLPVASSGRLLGVRRQVYDSLLIPEFPYEVSLEQLSAGSWPASTDNLTEMRLVMRYRPGQGWRQKLVGRSELVLDIFDYPGEWLLDLPLLNMSYEQWCDSIKGSLVDPKRLVLASGWLSGMKNVAPADPCDDQQGRSISAAYKNYLLACREQLGLYQLQPGRFLLPGDLAGAPVLNFFPWIHEDDQQGRDDYPADSWYQTQKRRYNYYREHVVKPFYQNHFSRFDRQIVLVDLLGALNQGEAAFSDMGLALEQALESFRYGRRGLLHRVFSPRIDKVLFAASQADRVTAEQHGALTGLLAQLLSRSIARLKFDDLQYSAMALAAVRATEQGEIHSEGDIVTALQGRSLKSDALLRLFPGEVPLELPNASFWMQQGFDFESFAPPKMNAGGLLGHIRLDSALDYLIGDKLR